MEVLAECGCGRWGGQRVVLGLGTDLKLSGIAWRSLVGAFAGWATALLSFWGFALNFGDPMSWDMMGGSAIVTIGIALVLFWPAALYLTWLGDKLAVHHAWARTPLTWALIGTSCSLITWVLTMPLVFGAFMIWSPAMLCAAAAGLATGLTSHQLGRRNWTS